MLPVIASNEKKAGIELPAPALSINQIETAVVMVNLPSTYLILDVSAKCCNYLLG
ncbi:MAG: hypothetical protein ACI88A_003395 [Paraglaciecola sp.]|jgi:hypothetical protein